MSDAAVGAYLLGFRDCLHEIEQAGSAAVYRQTCLLDDIFERLDAIEPHPHLEDGAARLYDQARDERC